MTIAGLCAGLFRLEVPEQALDEIPLGLNMSYIPGMEWKAGKSSHISDSECTVLRAGKVCTIQKVKVQIDGTSFLHTSHSYGGGVTGWLGG